MYIYKTKQNIIVYGVQDCCGTEHASNDNLPVTKSNMHVFIGYYNVVTEPQTNKPTDRTA